MRRSRGPSGRGMPSPPPVRARLLGALLTLAVAAALAGCTVTAVSDVDPSGASTPVGRVLPGDPVVDALPVGASERAMTWGGQIRMYRSYRPLRLAPLAPLVVMLHGGLGSARSAQAAYGWDALAESEGFVVVYPEAIGATWNVGGGCCGVAAAGGVDDVGFIRAAVAEVRARVSVDARRIYATGMSAGGMMAYRLACDTTVFAAIGPVAATQLGDCPNPSPLSVIHVHGNADPTVPYAAAAPAGGGVVAIAGPAIPALHDTWRLVNRCGGDVVQTVGTVTTATASCPSDRRVELVTLDGVGHEWPGVVHRGPLGASPSASAGTTASATASAPVPVGPTVPVPTAYPTTARLWEFFKQASR